MRAGVFASTLLATLAAASVPSVAAGKGVGPGFPAFEGVVAPDGESGYSAYPTRNGTVVIRIERGEVQPAKANVLPEHLMVPGVAADGTGSGASADGTTLILTPTTGATDSRARETSLAILDAVRLRVVDTVTIEGNFGFDAISPDGSTIYLIEYTARRDPSQYLVRAYDLDSGRLLPDPIVDPNESAEDMSGYPMTRAMSPDGRWAYTLYDGRAHPFIHALDTQAGTARCIDLDDGQVPRRDLYMAELIVSPDGGDLTVELPSGPVAVVDTQTFEVTEPASAPVEDERDERDGISWASIGALGAASLLAIGAVGVLRARARRRPAA